MEQLIAWLSRILNAWKFWLVVPPWEIAVRVRMGKHARALGPGPHLRVPFVDQITLVNTRLRLLTTPPVTIRNGQASFARVHRATCGFVIMDPLKAIQHYNDPTMAVMGLIQAKLAVPEPAGGLAEALRGLEENGIRVLFTELVEDVDVPTIRLLQGQSDVWGSSPTPPSNVHAQF